MVPGSTLYQEVVGQKDEPVTEAKTSSQHVAKYRDCGPTCVNDITSFYAEDLAFFGYQPVEF